MNGLASFLLFRGAQTVISNPGSGVVTLVTDDPVDTTILDDNIVIVADEVVVVTVQE